MAFVGMLVAAIGVLLFILFRMQQAANATRDITDAAGEASALWRRWQWNRKASANLVDG
ncbi:MAG: hypothetical protein RL291_449, partial [Pseudomonadota bacterium]